MDNEQVKERIGAALEASGLSRSAASRAAGLAPTFLRDVLEPGRKESLTVASLLKIAPVLGVDAGYLLTGQGIDRPALPVISYTGAGAEVFKLEPEEPAFDDVEAPPGAPADAFAVIVRGDSQFPVFNEGDVLICVAADPRHLLYKWAIVDLADGRRFLKELVPGTRNGRFTLRSKNAEDMIDAPVVSAARVLWRRIT